MNDRWNAKEREQVAFLANSLDGRLEDALTALREAESQDPTDLSTNYLIGFYLLRLNRPQATLDQYARVDAESWNAVTVGTWRYGRLATANHLLGRHDEELRVARIARSLFPTSFISRNDELIALAALGHLDELRRAADDTQTVAARGDQTPAVSMRVAAEELRAHGRRDESIAFARRAVAWYRNRPADYLAVPANRFLLAQSLYVAEQWTEASAIVSTLMREQPKSVAYAALGGAVAARMNNRNAALRYAAVLEQAPSEPGGITELRRAQLAALVGERDQAVALLRDAFARGLSMSAGLHRQMDLESLRGFSPFDDLMKPKH
jgi:predicted Zn-dependent protease